MRSSKCSSVSAGSPAASMSIVHPSSMAGQRTSMVAPNLVRTAVVELRSMVAGAEHSRGSRGNTMRRIWAVGILLGALVLAGCLPEGTYQVTPDLRNGAASVGLWHTF